MRPLRQAINHWIAALTTDRHQTSTDSNTSHLNQHTPPVRVLMVCLGNICRSPTAEGVLKKMVERAGWADRVQVDSAGTSDWHVGAPPDRRSQRHASQRGYDLSALRGRQLSAQDFTDFDWVLVMDASNESNAAALCPPAQKHKLRRLTEFCTHHRVDEIPDPYEGGAAGFEHVLDLIEDACEGFLQSLNLH